MNKMFKPSRAVIKHVLYYFDMAYTHTHVQDIHTVKWRKMRTAYKSAHKKQCHVTSMCRCTKKYKRNEVEPKNGDRVATR